MKKDKYLGCRGIIVFWHFNYSIRMLVAYMAVLLSYSLLIALCDAQPIKFTSSSEQKQTDNIEKHKPFRLAITDFEKLGGHENYDSLSRSLKESIAMSLITNDIVEYVPGNKFWDAAPKVLNKSRKELEGNDSLIFTDDVLEELEIDLVLKGSFYEYRGKIQFEATLTDRRKRKKEFIEITSKPVGLKGIYSEIEVFNKKLYGAILTLVAESKANRIAVICFKDISDPSLESNDWLNEDLAISLISYLDPEKEMKIIPWSETKNFCNEDITNDIKILEILNKVNADALLSGKYVIEDYNITITPTLYVREKRFLRKDGESGINLIATKGNLNNYFDLEDALSEDVSVALDMLMEGDGRFDIDLLRFSYDSLEEYIEQGKKFIESKDNIQQAARVFVKAIEKYPNDPDPHYQLGLVRIKQGRYQEAINELKSTKECEEEYIDAYLKLGEVYLELGEYKKARDELIEVSELSRKHSGSNNEIPDIHYRLGEVYYLLGESETAIDKLEKALKVDSKNPEVFNLLARSYQAQGYDKKWREKEKYEKKAIDNLKRALDIDPKNVETLSVLSNIYLENGRKLFISKKYDEALNLFNQAKGLKPGASIYGWLIFTLNKLKMFEKSIEILNEAIDLNYVNYQVYNNGAIAHNQLGRYNEAIMFTDKSIELEPGLAILYTNKGTILTRMERYEEGISALDEAIMINPEYKPAYNAKAYAFSQSGRYDEAILASEKAIEKDPNFANPYNHKGFSLYKLGKHREGIHLIKKSIKLDPKYGGSYSTLRGFIREMGKFALH